MIGDKVNCHRCGNAIVEGTPDTMTFLMLDGRNISYCPPCRGKIIYESASQSLILQFASLAEFTPEEIIESIVDLSIAHNDPIPAQIVGDEIEHLLTEGIIGVNSRNDGTVYIIPHAQEG